MGNCISKKYYVCISYRILNDHYTFDKNKYKEYLFRLFHMSFVEDIQINDYNIILFYDKSMSKGVIRRKLNILLPSGTLKYLEHSIYIQDLTFKQSYFV